MPAKKRAAPPKAAPDGPNETVSDDLTNGQPDDLAELSYEQARDELLEVVRQLEAGGASLAQSLTLWERGEALANRCQAWLDGARERLDAAQAEPASPPSR